MSGEQHGAEALVTSEHNRMAPPRWHWVLVGVVALAYLVVILAGITTSSLGMDTLRVDPTASHDDYTGTLQWIRSDEYNVITPIQLSEMATGGQPTLSPLGAEASLIHRYPVGIVQSMVFWDTLLFRVGPWLPNAQLFAAHWWLPTVLVLLCMPTWFVLMGGRRHLGWLAGALVVVAPSNFWWSLQPTGQLAYVLAGCTAMLAAARRFERGQWWRPLGQCVLAGLCIAGMPSNYLLWSMLLGGGVLLASSVRLISRWNRGALLALGVSGLLAAMLGVGVLVEGRAGLEALTSTVYPGARRSTGTALNVGFLFGAPALGALNQVTPALSNASELSTGLNVSLLLLPAVWLLSPLIRWRARLGEFVLAAWGWLWLVWCMVALGSVGQRIPIMSSVPPERAAQAIGVVGVIALCLGLSHIRSGRLGPAIWSGLGAALVSLQAGSILRQDYLPDMRMATVFGSGLAVGAAVFLLVWMPRRWYGPALAALLAVVEIAHASPYQFGLGDLRGTPAADYFHQQGQLARADGQLWASNDLAIDILMLANGVPSLSGMQRSGPDREAWLTLDEQARFEQAWNRGGGYSNFYWTEGLPTEITSNGYDVISTAIDPCRLAELEPRLGHIVSNRPLTASPCLQRVDEVTWVGRQFVIYEVSG